MHKIVTFLFNTKEEAKCFTDGVEWVNDSAIELVGIKQNKSGKWVAKFIDNDATGD